MAGKPIVISIVGDNRQLDRALGQSESRLSKFGKIGKAAGLGLAAGVGVAAVGLFKLTKGAAEDAAAQARLAKTLQNTAGATKAQVSATEDWITKQGLATGVTDDELRPALARIATATKDVGKAQSLTALAMDVSAGTGKSLTTVTEALMKAQNGQIGGLGRLGIATKDAQGKTLSFDQVTKNMATTFGGQAATQANTLEGKMARLKLVLAETGESIGAKLLPVATNLATWFLNKGVPAISHFAGVIATKARPILTAFTKAWRDLAPALTQVFQKFVAVAGPILKVGVAVASKVIPPLLRLTVVFLKNVLGAIGSALGALARIHAAIFAFGGALVTAGKKAVEFARTIISKINAIPGEIKDAGTKLLGIGSDLVGGLIQGIKNKAKDLVSTIKTYILDKIPGPLKKALKIFSPSRVMKEIGTNIVDGLTLGIRDQAPTISRTMDRLATDISSFHATPTIQPTLGTYTRPAIARGRALGAGGTLEVRLTADQLHELERGRAIALDLAAWQKAGGRL